MAAEATVKTERRMIIDVLCYENLECGEKDIAYIEQLLL